MSVISRLDTYTVIHFHNTILCIYEKETLAMGIIMDLTNVLSSKRSKSYGSIYTDSKTYKTKKCIIWEI